MHEGKIAQYVFDLVQETLDADPELVGRRVKALTFSLAPPYSVVPDAFAFYFTELVKGSPIEGAQLLFEEDESLEFGAFYLSGIEVFE